MHSDYTVGFAMRSSIFDLRSTSKRAVVFLAVCGAILLASCAENMRNDGRIKPYEPNPAGGGISEQPIDPNAVARSQTANFALEQGKDAGGNLVTTFPVDVTTELLQRGQARYTIYCVPCHGAQGDGKGLITNFGMPNPPSYQDAQLLSAPVGHFFDVITNGKGKMYSYASRISVNDRWAIVAYVRALQKNPQAPLEVTPEQLQQAGGVQ
jgi:mono/diheme cytochrome c family protein